MSSSSRPLGSRIDELTDLLVAAIRDSLGRLSPLDCANGLAGYALIVDPDMVAVLGAAVSRKAIDDADNPALLFQPVDWPIEFHSTQFEQAAERLEHLFENEDVAGYDERVGVVVVCLMKALERARELEGLLERTLLLLVCADGGGVWEKLEGDVVRRLNGTVAYERWSASNQR